MLLIVVELQSEDFVRLVRVNAEGDLLNFEDPDTQDDIGYTADDISWWARIEESLPQNDQGETRPQRSDEPQDSEPV